MSGPSVNSDVNVDTRLALMEKEFGVVNDMFRRFETALDKMSDATVVMQRMIAIHDKRLDDREAQEKNLLEGMERRKEDLTRRDRDTVDRLDRLGSDLRGVIREEVGSLKKNIDEKLEALEEGQDELSAQLTKNIASLDNEIDKIELRLRDLERWRWFIVGGSAVLGFIIAKLPVLTSVLHLGGPA